LTAMHGDELERLKDAKVNGPAEASRKAGIRASPHP
jgi:hypothetical protein